MSISWRFSTMSRHVLDDLVRWGWNHFSFQLTSGQSLALIWPFWSVTFTGLKIKPFVKHDRHGEKSIKVGYKSEWATFW